MPEPVVHVAGLARWRLRPTTPRGTPCFGSRWEASRLGAPSGRRPSLHVWVEVNGAVVAVARGHLIEGDGAAADHSGPGAAQIPSFSPLRDAAPDLRPAMQVRQMGVLEAWRGTGLGALALDRLLRASVRVWGARTGWLQAREAAIGFYARMGWVAFDPPYGIEGVGPHRSMWRSLDDLFD